MSDDSNYGRSPCPDCGAIYCGGLCRTPDERGEYLPDIKPERRLPLEWQRPTPCHRKDS